MYRKFKHLNIPDGWEQYWSKYPNGYTIMEALIDWVSQVDDMVDNQNELSDTVKSFGERIDDFINQFGVELQKEVQDLLTEWQGSGFLNIVISEALQWQLDDYIATNEQDKLSLTAQLQQKVPKKQIIPQDEHGHGINISSPNLENVTYENLEINVEKYGILWNNGTKGGKNLRITKCVIFSDKSDGIEINTFGTLNDELFKNIIITENFIKTGEVMGNPSAGFGIGLASGQNMVIANNVIEQSSKEGIHIEGLIRNLIVTGNVVDLSLGDGIVLYGDLENPDLVERSLISLNSIRGGRVKQGTGVHLTYSTSTVYGIGNIPNNKIRNFNNGILTASDINVTGTEIEDCNVAINLYIADVYIEGIITTKNVPTLLKVQDTTGSRHTYFTGFKTKDTLDITRIIDKTDSMDVTIRTMSYFVPLGGKNGDGYVETAISLLPKNFKGTITVASLNSGNSMKGVFECEVKAGVLTKFDLIRKASGSYGNPTLYLEDNRLKVRFISSLSTVNQKMKVTLDGNIVF